MCLCYEWALKPNTIHFCVYYLEFFFSLHIVSLYLSFLSYRLYHIFFVSMPMRLKRKPERRKGRKNSINKWTLRFRCFYRMIIIIRTQQFIHTRGSQGEAKTECANLNCFVCLPNDISDKWRFEPFIPSFFVLFEIVRLLQWKIIENWLHHHMVNLLQFYRLEWNLINSKNQSIFEQIHNNYIVRASFFFK